MATGSGSGSGSHHSIGPSDASAGEPIATTSSTFVVSNSDIALKVVDKVELKASDDYVPVSAMYEGITPTTSKTGTAESVVVESTKYEPSQIERNMYATLPGDWYFDAYTGNWVEGGAETVQTPDGHPDTYMSTDGYGAGGETEVKTVAVVEAGGANPEENSNDTGAYPPNFDFYQAIDLQSLGGITAYGISGENLGRWDLNNDNLIDVLDLVKYTELFKKMSKSNFQTKMGHEYMHVYDVGTDFER